MTVVPPYLQHGNCIGIVCPSGFMPIEKVQTCIRVLDEWGYKVKVGKTVGHQFHYLSGTDEERLADLQQMLDDPDVHAVLCARGGYGLTRIIDKLCFKKFVRNPKWLIGFSDITVLHAHVYRQFGIASLHAPMAAAFNDEEYKNEFVQSLRNVLSAGKCDYTYASSERNRIGSASGKLVGGNLSILAHLCGTPSALKTKGKILFLEDVGEYIYNIDRMLYQLKRSGKLDKLAGLIIGGFTDLKDTTIPFGQSFYDLVADITSEFDYPVAYDFPVSHARENYALKIGVQHRLTVGNNKTRLKEK